MHQYFVVCPCCCAPFEVREVSPYRISEGPQGEDIVTFDCPRCGRPDVESPVRRGRCEI
jgi:hypothetical protein